MSKEIATPPVWNPLENNHGMYEELRNMCPVARSEEFGGVWGLFRYEDIVMAAKDTETFSNANPRHAGRPRPPLESDPPQHSVIRKAMQPFFGKKQMEQMEPIVRKIVAEHLEPMLDRGQGDFISEIAHALPVRTIQAFLHLPDEEWTDVLGMSQAIFEASYGNARDKYEEAVGALDEYCRKVIAERRKNPLDPATDIMSRMLELEIDGKPIDDQLATGILSLLLTAGHESTIVSQGIIAQYLANHPDVQQQLRENPGLIPSAIEEILRYDSPVVRMPRTLKKDIELHGVKMKAGDKVFLMWGSGNRDGEAFEKADQVVLDRSPNRHLIFGFGIHKCIGAPIALLELRVLFEQLLTNTTSFKINGEVVRTGYPHFGFRSLPLELSRKG
jgi:cytochrome P450